MSKASKPFSWRLPPSFPPPPPPMLPPLPPPPPPPPPLFLWRAPKAMPSKPANRWQPAADAVVPKKAMPLFKAVAAETDATNMVEATPVADATKVVDEGRGKRYERKGKSRTGRRGIQRKVEEKGKVRRSWHFLRLRRSTRWLWQGRQMQ